MKRLNRLSTTLLTATVIGVSGLASAAERLEVSDDVARQTYQDLNQGSDDAARRHVTALFGHVPVLDTGGRGATTTFSQRGIGDVLLTFENEVALLRSEAGDSVEAIVPSPSVRADNPVAVVDKFDVYGSRARVQALHFADGASFDQIYAARR